MIFSYDYDVDALYIEIADSPVVRTRQFDKGTLVDLDESGDLVGIEVLRPARDWPLDEIAASYGLGEDDAAVLNSVWGTATEPKPYPFSKPLRLVG